MCELSKSALSEAARSYVVLRGTKAGGFVEAAHGLWHKTGPIVLGFESISLLRISGLAARAALLAAAASVPVLVRKVLAGAPAAGKRPLDVLVDTLTKLDAIDYVLAGLAIASTFIPRLLEVFAKRRPTAGRHLPYIDLTTAIEQMPSIDGRGRGRDRESENAVDDALNSTLRALREEMAELLDDQGRQRLTDVTLLEFCDVQGTHMRVRARTVTNEPSRRPVESYRMLAYYVAMQGRPFVEHDFLDADNPFPPVRLTVPGAQKVDYRSVLYLPIMWSIEEDIALLPGGHGAPERRVIDNVMGVICVHCAKPYRFWRWGDHKKPRDGFGNVAYARALPYIALITRLLEGTSPKVRLESQ